jgi:S-DNA-T family DNA segregation ATPase FtsK/SpoIIIE
MSRLVVHRPARTLPPPVPTGELALTPPPRLAGSPFGAAAWLTYLFPAIGGTGSLVFMLARPTPLFIAAGVLFALGSVALGVGMYAQQRSGQRGTVLTDRLRYLEYLDRVRATARETARRQHLASAWRHPAPDHLWAVAASPQRRWERRPHEDDFLDVRVGLGPVPLTTRLALPLEDGPTADYEPVSLAAARRLVACHGTVDRQPVTVPLARTGVLSLVGDRDAARAVAAALVCQVAALHAPDDVRLACCAGPGAAHAWEWVKWLPHVRPPDGDGDQPARLIASGLARLETMLRPELEARRREARRHPNLAGTAAATPGQRPHLVVVLDTLPPAGQAAWLHELAPDPGALGVTLVHLVDAPRDEPPRVDARARVRGGDLQLERAGELRRARADAIALVVAEGLARALAPLRLSAGSPGRILVQQVGLPELLGRADVAGLDPGRTWAPRPLRETLRETLRAPIGLGGDGQPVVLDLKESALGGMGPHGLVVGATGAGKSELLRTLVTALAIDHAPEELAFVLVDYKGGATFADMTALPHVAGMITNLADDLALVDRMHAALSGELRRRQQLLRDAGNLASTREYHQRRAAGDDLPPLPVLLVIIDEFGELLASRPEFIDVFVAMGRVGRSLGMHLLLASQRLEEGRLRGLESHLSYRICLRTFSVMESRIVLGVPDAFELPPVPGSAYLQVDTSVFERFKVASVSVPYRSSRPAEQTRPGVAPFAACDPAAAPEAAVAAGDGRAGEEGEETGGPSVLDVVVERLRDDARRAHQVWLPPLPPTLTLDRLFPTPSAGGILAPARAPGRLGVALGLLDKPQEQAQEPLVVEFAGATGHLAVVGAPQTGKTTLLRTLLAAFVLTHRPADVQFYCVDLGGGLGPFAHAPHVGTVAGRLDPERVRRTVATIAALLEERAQRFPARGIDSVERLRALRAAGQLPDEPLGDVFLVVDSWPALRQDFEDLEPVLTDVAARGLGYGIHLVVTANRWMDFRPALRDSLRGRLELRLGDPIESEVSRKEADNVPVDVPGRGLTPDGLHFQVALPRLGGHDDASGLQPAIDGLVEHLATLWDDPPAPPVLVLPTDLAADALPAPDQDPQPGVPVGVAEDDLAPVYLNLAGADPHLLVLGDGESGRTNLLRVFLHGLAERTDPDRAKVLLVDYRRTLLGAVDDRRLLGYAGNAPAAAAMVAELVKGLQARLPGPSLSLDELRTRSWWDGPDVYLVVDDYDLVAAGTGNPLLPLVEFLPQARDIGFRLLVARRVGGAGRALFEPLLQRLKELGTTGIILSGDPQEGPLLAGHKATPRVPGRGLLLRRRERPVLVQVARSVATGG